LVEDTSTQLGVPGACFVTSMSGTLRRWFALVVRAASPSSVRMRWTRPTGRQRVRRDASWSPVAAA